MVFPPVSGGYGAGLRRPGFKREDGCGKECLRPLPAALCFPAAFPLAVSFGGGRLRTRVERILSYKRMTVGAALFSGGLLAALAAALLTNAVP